MTDLVSLSADQLAEKVRRDMGGAWHWSDDREESRAALAELQTRANQHDERLTVADTAEWRTLAENALKDLEADDDTRPFGWDDCGASELAAALLAACTQLEQAQAERDELKERTLDAMGHTRAAEKERDEALEAVSRLTADCEVCRGESAAEARLAETQKALRFYAAESTYEEASPVGSALEGTIPIREDRGSIARAALTTHPEEKP